MTAEVRHVATDLMISRRWLGSVDGCDYHIWQGAEPSSGYVRLRRAHRHC